jgi:hypothetical protein
MCTEFWLEKPERKKPLGRLRQSLEDTIKMGHKEVRWEVVNWILVAQDRDW